jgi:RND family efflux transporter MFP subunit
MSSTPADSLKPDFASRPQPPAPTEVEQESRRLAGRRLIVIALVAIVLFAGAIVGGTVPRLRLNTAVTALAEEAATSLPRVNVAQARPGSRTATQQLPGNSLPLMETSVYARTNGYLKRWYVDIGDHVKEGQLLAEISAPDVDAQLAQARANLALAEANLPLAQANADVAKVTLDRFIEAGPGTGATLLQIDQQRAAVKTTAAQVQTAKASVAVNQAAVELNTVLQQFQKILAPFPGVITTRNIDTGDLVSADAPTTTELFHLMRTDTIRVFVNVPQVYSTTVKVGQKAVVFRREEPEKQYSGTVVRTANALDLNSRTLLTQIDVPNPDDLLRPGMYLQVRFDFDRDVPPLIIPTAAVIVRSAEPRVAILDDQHRIQYKSVQLGRDYGAIIEIVSGLNAGDVVVVHPGDDLPAGTAVQPVNVAVDMPK